jgi:hypothetical protein
MAARGLIAVFPAGADWDTAGACAVVCANAIPAAMAATVANLIKFVFMGFSTSQFQL